MLNASRFILPIILLALTSIAEASDANMLIGKWAGPCNMANSASLADFVDRSQVIS